MKNVSIHIFLTQQDKERSDIVDFIIRESGNTKEEVLAYLQSNDVITVPKIPMKHAEKIIRHLKGLDVLASIAAEKDDAFLYQDDSHHANLGWNWWAFFFTFIWYFFKKLWVKASVYIMFEWLISVIPLPAIVQIVVGLAFWIYIGKYANYDLHLKEVEQEELWPKIPYRKWKKIYTLCSLLFLVLAVGLPVYKGFGAAKYGMESIMEYSKTNDARVELVGNTTFTAIPNTWWKFVSPPPGMTINASEKKGNVTGTITYESKKTTKMMGIICTTPPMSGLDNKTIGIVAVELRKPLLWNKYTTVDEAKVVSQIVNEFTVKLPMFFEWLARFISCSHSEPLYKPFRDRTWGSCTITRELSIAGQKIRTLGDIYWTILEGHLLVVYTDYFPQYMGQIRGQVVRLMDSLQAGDMPHAVDRQDTDMPVPVVEQMEIGVDSTPVIEDSVESLTQAGMHYLKQGDREQAEECLQKALTLVHSEDDLYNTDRLQDELTYQ